MSNPGSRLKARARRLWRWFFPEKVALPDEAVRVLAAVFPRLDLDAVSFHRGLPHFVRLLRSQAITLPDLLAPRRTRIYFDPPYLDPGSVEGLGTVVHEAYHALQVQDSRWGIGPLRPFIVLYLACGAANGFRYRGHPMENDAYALAGRRHSPFERAACFEPCEQVAARLAVPGSGLRFWGKLARSTPGVGRFLKPETRRLWLVIPLAFPPVLLWLILWSGAAALAWLARLLVEMVGAVAAGALWTIGSILSWFDWRGKSIEDLQ
ncbi:MAG TPA: hypothetical protein VJ725_10120 [Thermoanaerobaculia bacterium]|nr:hypothetical protein [Thermoanaerobaculia bacterium]